MLGNYIIRLKKIDFICREKCCKKATKNFTCVNDD